MFLDYQDLKTSLATVTEENNSLKIEIKKLKELFKNFSKSAQPSSPVRPSVQPSLQSMSSSPQATTEQLNYSQRTRGNTHVHTHTNICIWYVNIIIFCFSYSTSQMGPSGKE